MATLFDVDRETERRSVAQAPKASTPAAAPGPSPAKRGGLLIVELRTPQGFRARFERLLEPGEEIPQASRLEQRLRSLGYKPEPPQLRTDWCDRHECPMSEREKQGDTWGSHRVRAPDGRELWCKGRPGADSPGYDVVPRSG